MAQRPDRCGAPCRDWSRLAQLIVYPSCRGEHIFCNQLELARVATIDPNNGDNINGKVEVSRAFPG